MTVRNTDDKALPFGSFYLFDLVFEERAKLLRHEYYPDIGITGGVTQSAQRLLPARDDDSLDSREAHTRGGVGVVADE